MSDLSDRDRLDTCLLEWGAVTLYWRVDELEKATASLAALGYHVIDISYESQKQFQDKFSRELKWIDKFGYSPWNGNLNAFVEALQGEPQSSEDYSVLAIRNFDKCVRYDSKWAENFLDICAICSREYLIHATRLIILVQTNDASYQTEKLGGVAANWNLAEWFGKSRGIR